jgi:hypothetical protein
MIFLLGAALKHIPSTARNMARWYLIVLHEMMNIKKGFCKYLTRLSLQNYEALYLRLPQQHRHLNSQKRPDINADRQALQVSANIFRPIVAPMPYVLRTVSKVPTTPVYTTVAIIEAASKRIVDTDVTIIGSNEPTKENIAQNPIRVDAVVADIAAMYSFAIALDAEW